MRKLHLDPEELVVESFDTASRKRNETGTVRGQSETEWIEGCEVSGGSYCATCGYHGQMCWADTGTCFASCLMTGSNDACIEPNCMG